MWLETQDLVIHAVCFSELALNPKSIARAGVAPRKELHISQRVGVVSTELYLLDRQCLFEDSDRVGVLVEVGVELGQAQHSPEGVGVVGPKPGFLKDKCLLAELDSIGVSADGLVAAGQVNHAEKSRGVIGA